MEPLPDPLSNRKIKQFPPPPQRKLPLQILIKDGKPNIDLLKKHLEREGRIQKNAFLWLIAGVSQLFSLEKNCIEVADPITIVGDIHGQFYDLLKILDIGGADAQYLFLGDYVDRGSFSVQCLILLFALKLCKPKNFRFLRGNHQSRQMTAFFNFRLQCISKFDQEVYDRLMDCFDQLPLCAVLNGNFFTVHGGISPNLVSVMDIQAFDRKAEPPKEGVICDLLWADPNQKEKGFVKNNVRSCSYFFGGDAVKTFLQKNKLLSVVRGHEAQAQGFKFHWPRAKGLPQVMTIFSAPNYCDCYNNRGAVINFKNNVLNVKQFNYTQHPFILPNFMTLFDWSLPFLAEKVSQMFLYLLKTKKKGHEQDAIDDLFVGKVDAICKILDIQKEICQQNSQVMKLKGLCPDNKVPKDILFVKQSKDADFKERFYEVLVKDIINDRAPF